LSLGRQQRRSALPVHVKPISAEHGCELRTGRHHLQLLLNSGGIADVILVLNRVVLPLHQLDSPVERYRSAGVRLASDTNPTVATQVGDGVEAVVTAAVIDNYDVQVPIRLVYDA